jgi:DNA topoisomerase-1
LDKIAQGQAERDTVLKNFYKPFKESLAEFAGLKGKQTEPTVVDCPECKKQKLVIRFGKNGEFLGCAGFPECNFTSQFSRNENNEIVLVESKAQELEETCPKCQKNLREVVGRFGPFVACSGYPECNYIKQEKADFKCPKCQSDIVKRSSKNGKFWGCAGYPKCRFAIFDETINQECPDCKLPFMVIKKTKEQSITKCYEKDCAFNTKTK